MTTTQPFFSVIAPCFKVAGTLRRAITSVVDQSFRDFELIIVDDCSPDISGAIAAEIASGDERVSVITPDANQGLGGARNIGIDAATGRYLLFLDTDDWFETGALEAIAGRLQQVGYPNMLIFDYERAYWWGRRARNITGHLLAEEDDQPTFTLAERPQVLEILNVAWNKAYSAEFIAATGIRFPPGLYEDLPWTYPLLMEARSIATLNCVAISYRQSRGGSILKSSSDRHIEVLDQWRRVFDWIDADPAREPWRTPLFERALDHTLMMAGNQSNRIPATAVARFRQDAGRLLAAIKPPGYVYKSKGTRIKAELLANGLAPVYAGLRSLHAYGNIPRPNRRNLTQPLEIGEQAKRAIKKGLHQTANRLPLDESTAIFSAYWSNQYAGNPRAISEALLASDHDVEPVWVFAGEPPDHFPKDLRWVEKSSAEFHALSGRVKYLINNVNFDQFMIRRSGAIHVQTQHGTPLKKMGLDLRHHPTAAGSMNFEDLLARCDRWDINLSSNRYSSEIWERAFPCNFETAESGYPRNDALVAAHREGAPATAAARERLGITGDAAGNRVLLYMPTFRASHAEFELGEAIEALRSSLDESWTILVRAHYFYSDAGLKSSDNAGIVDVSDHPVVEDAYIASDVLLTDYSSAMFDYANLRRPTVLYVPDFERYNFERGMYFDIREFPPGQIASTLPALVDVFATGRFEDSTAMSRINRFADFFCEFDDGNAAMRVVDTVFGGKELSAQKSRHDLAKLSLYEMPDWSEPDPDHDWGLHTSQATAE